MIDARRDKINSELSCNNFEKLFEIGAPIKKFRKSMQVKHFYKDTYRNFVTLPFF